MSWIRKDIHFIITNVCFSICMNDMFYVSANSYEICYIYSIKKKSFNVESKHPTNDTNQTYLWLCGLGHINLNRIQRLHN